MKKIYPALVIKILIVVLFSPRAFGHPGGNLLVVQDHVLWSYVDPIDSPSHIACVMIKKGDQQPKLLLRSEHAASDFFLSSTKSTIYIIERYYIQRSDSYRMRVFEMPLGGAPKVIWNWREDTHRIGEAGFQMSDSKKILFVKYPSVWKTTKNGDFVELEISDKGLVRLRSLENGEKLLLSESTCHLYSFEFKELKSWENLPHKNVKDPPLGRNNIFDADYSNEDLLIAYWGNRSFDLLRESGRTQLSKLDAPRVPHWVAFYKEGWLLFDSEMRFDGTNPMPKLYYLKGEHLKLIWPIP